MSRALDDAVIAALGGGVATMADLRKATGAGDVWVRASVQRLRFKGKIRFDRLELSPSMMEAVTSPAASDGEAGETEDGQAGGFPPAKGEGAPAAPRIAADAPDSGVEPGEGAAAPVTGEQLHDELRLYCARTGTKGTQLGRVMVGRKEYLNELLRSTRPKPETVERVRRFIADHPDGIEGLAPVERECRPRAPRRDPGRTAAPAAVVPVRPAPEPEVSACEIARLEAEGASERRRQARMLHSIKHPPPSMDELRRDLALSPVEAVQTMCVEDPHDLVVAINRRHPALWRRVVLLGRALGETPAAALYRALERGLEAEEAVA